MTHKAYFAISGMTCAACANRIEKVIGRINGLQANVNLATEQAVVVWDPTVYSDSSYIQKLTIETVQKIGYKADGINPDEYFDLTNPKTLKDKTPFWEAHWSDIWLSILFSIQFWIGMGVMSLHHVNIYLDTKLYLVSKSEYYTFEVILATLVQFWCGRRFYIQAFKVAKSGSTNMDVLVVLSTSIAYFYSLFNLAFVYSPELFFEASASVITFVLIGKLLENNAKQNTHKLIKDLASLQPKVAAVKRGEEWVQLDVSLIKRNDIFAVKAGEAIPVDGIIFQGEAEIDESMLTGESIPVYKKLTDKVMAGTINTNGLIYCQALEIGSQTVLAKIIRLVQEAQAAKIPIQQLAGKVSGRFIPAVIGIAIATALGWMYFNPEMAFKAAITVLVIACPCALGLATPTAIMVASGRAAQLGILIRNANVLEHASKIKTIFFDKTGTLTQSHPQVDQIIHYEELIIERRFVRYLLLLEDSSSHPLAKTIVQYIRKKYIFSAELVAPRVENMQYFAGQGVSAKLNGDNIILGSIRWIESHRVYLPKDLVELQEQGKMLVVMANLDIRKVVGAVILTDKLRPSAIEMLDKLDLMQIKSIMVTGDHRTVAADIAQKAMISQCYAELMPEQKAAIIEDVKQSFVPTDPKKSPEALVAMVGDGINDTPAFAKADISFAVSSANDVAHQYADVILTHDNLNSLIDMINLSTATLKIIKQNLFFAFIYNIIGIGLAVAGIIHPAIAGLAMALSSVSVVMNALRLRKFKGH